MEKSFINVVQDSPRARLGMPVKTKNPLSRTNTPPTEPPFGFKLHGRLVPVYSRVGLLRHPFAWNPRPPATRPLGLTDQSLQSGEEKDPCPNRGGSSVRQGLATKGAGPDAISTGPPCCFAPDAHPALLSSSLV